MAEKGLEGGGRGKGGEMREREGGGEGVGVQEGRAGISILYRA